VDYALAACKYRKKATVDVPSQPTTAKSLDDAEKDSSTSKKEAAVDVSSKLSILKSNDMGSASKYHVIDVDEAIIEGRTKQIAIERKEIHQSPV